MSHVLHTLEQALLFALGDFAVDTQAQCGEEASQVLDAADGWAASTRRNAIWVAERVPEAHRMIPPLTFSHSQVVAALTHEQQRKWLLKAATGDGTDHWTVDKLKKEMAAAGEGKTKTRFWLVIECGGEQKQMKLAERLEAEGFIVVRKSGVKKVATTPRKRKAAKTVTARKRRASKINTKRRVH
jgi:hypothetical protein